MTTLRQSIKKIPHADKIVYVEWVDSVTRNGWAHANEMREWGINHTIQTIGFIAFETKEHISIVQSLDTNDDNQVGCNWLAIPKSQIKRRLMI